MVVPALLKYLFCFVVSESGEEDDESKPMLR